jgi:hypothetical protein
MILMALLEDKNLETLYVALYNCFFDNHEIL